ncbi:hypothetical protein B0J11DRAFT_528234 [Dendryphion nanum]|uniref:Uncharacterized protein n=1 Tax=Dendryphion nanum TaxID=256645 RepID=A0A9P9ILZ3_9PLEO|nr:hypothetical protein B0J11DRAFT_528234 [Dendryphion nanum]
MSTNSESWSGPGLMQLAFSIPSTSKLSQETFDTWLNEVYLPALIDSGVVLSAWRYRAANLDYPKQHIALLKIGDLAPVQDGAIQKISRTSDKFPTNGPVEEFVDSESKIFALDQLFETERQPEDVAKTIIWAAMEPQPGGEADLDAWYRDEHNQQMSEQPGWKRTTRFKLLYQHRSDGREPEYLSFVAIHEFGEGHHLGKNVEPLDPMTEWTKRCMSAAKGIDAAIYEKTKHFGRKT